MHKINYLGFFLFLGCGHGVALTPEGELIQEIEPDAAEDCKDILSDSGLQWFWRN